jgi:hypothetical protein
MRGGVFSKNIWEGANERASERRNDNIIVSGPLKIGPFGPIFTKNNVFLLKLKLNEISKIYFLMKIISCT